MKRCPTCDKEFPDSMRFCQTDGTVLIEDAPAADPYKTVVGNQSDIASAIPPLDPFKTMVAGAPPKPEADILQLPDEPDQMKTMVVSPIEMQEEIKASGNEDMLSLDSSPPASYAPSAPLIEPKPASDFSAPPKPSESISTEATMIMNSGNLSESSPSPFDSKPFENDFSSQSPYGNQDNKPIPSPFQDSLQPNYQPPSASPFDAPTPPTFQEPESPFGSSEPVNSPFQPPTPFGQPESSNQQVQEAGWTPPSLPDSQWQNQDLGSNMPSQSPAGSGPNQTLAIVSLILGILSFLCGGIFLGIPAIITGYMQRNNIKSNPAEYGGGTLATIGMILGVVNLVLTVVVVIIYIILLVSASR